MSGAPESSKNHKICEMNGVRSYGNGDDPIELWLNDSGRLVVVAYNEAGYCGTEVDLYDLIEWLQVGPGRRMVLDHGSCAAGIECDPTRNRKGP